MDVANLVYPPGASRHDWIIDGALTAALGLVSVTPYALMGLGYSGAGYLSYALASALMILPLMLRRHAPLLTLVGCTVAGIAQVIVSPYPLASILAVPIVAYSVARWVPGPIARSVVVVGGIGSAIGPARWIFTGGYGPSLVAVASFGLATFVCLGLTVTPYAVGRRVRESSEARQQRLDAANERYQMQVTEREQQARVAEVNARNLIAREIHDIVAHSLSVIIVQAEGGKALARKRPEAAAESLDTIAEIGREALAEMRRIVSVLRRGPEADGPTEYAPAPGLDDIPEMIRRTSDRATLLVSGDVPRVSQTLGLTAYRVAQEGLTNFLKHAGPDAHADVTLTYTPEIIEIEVADNGLGHAARGDGRGHGLRGMNERVAAMGGTLVARPRLEGGFLVRAMLPIRPAPGPARPIVRPIPPMPPATRRQPAPMPPNP